MPATDWSTQITITHEPVATHDEYGKPATYGSAVTYRARVDGRKRMVTSIGSNGQPTQTISDGSVIILGTPTVGLSDRITLPDGRTPVLLAVRPYYDDKALHHVTVDFKA